MKTFSLLCLFVLVLILSLLSGDASAARIKSRMPAKHRTLAKNKAYTFTEADAVK